VNVIRGSNGTCASKDKVHKKTMISLAQTSTMKVLIVEGRITRALVLELPNFEKVFKEECDAN